MTKTNKIRSALLALVCACCLAPAAAAWNAGAFDKPAPAPVAEEAPAPKPAPAAEEAPVVVDLPAVVITATAQGKARPVAKKAKANPGCRLQALEQGGSPAAPFVLVCG